MKKILVTGATGQIGRFLIRKFDEKKYDFTGLDIRPSEKLSGLNIPSGLDQDED